MADAEAAPTGLLVDWGGVLTSDLFATFATFCTTEGLDPSTVRDLFRHDPEARRTMFALETGELTEPEFEERFAAILGLGEDRAFGLVDRIFGALHEEPSVIDAVKAVKRHGVRTGLLSNSWGIDRYNRSHFPELFDVLVISGEEGVRKPDRGIYEIALERMALPAGEILFIDDLPGNLKPARELGMRTLHHTDPATTIAALGRLFGLPAA